MLLRICLILAILTGVGVIGVSQFMLKPQIEEIITNRNTFEQERNSARTELSKTKTTLKNTNEKLAKTESTLEETKTQLTATTAKFEGEQKRANGLQDGLNKSNSELKAAKDELFAYTSTSVKPEEIKSLVASVKSLTVESQALKVESQMLARKVTQQENTIKTLTGGAEDPPLPRDIRGKVVVVDPKWDFLVLDIGAKNSLVQNGVLLVSRNGELVAKVRVMEVQENRSIANIMPGWKIKDVTEGDMVLPY